MHGLSGDSEVGARHALMTDNGSAMMAEEVTEELVAGYCPRLHAAAPALIKTVCESVWGTLEGRRMPMRDKVAEVTRDLLNEATQRGNRLHRKLCAARQKVCQRAIRAGVTCFVSALRANRSGMHFAWKSSGLNVTATARSRWKGCGSRSRPGIATFARSWCTTRAEI